MKTVFSALAVVLIGNLNVGCGQNVVANDGTSSAVVHLEETFDFVERFDGLLDWSAGEYGNIIDTSEMPRKAEDSSASMWNFYASWTKDSGDSLSIGYHGPENTLGGKGKSLRLDYMGAGGPTRFGLYLGSGNPEAGYSEVYVFYMNKYTPAFFPIDGTGKICYFDYLKTFHACSGFRDVMEWGTVEQQSVVGNQNALRNNYGLNYVIVNFDARDNLHTNFAVRYANESATSTIKADYLRRGIALETFVNSQRWFGIELRFRLSDPAGTDNGEIETWIYSEDGTVVTHDKISDAVTLGDGAKGFNHKYNKFFWGGNRKGFETSGNCTGATTGVCYLDDIIISGKRIGPTYFGVVNQSSAEK